MARARTLGELRGSGYQPKSIRLEVRDNLRCKLAAGEPLFPGILGYERTVIPGVVNALLAGHDFILLGLRGQAKTRILRALTDFLDDEVPVVAGSELNDDPLAPVSTWAAKRVEEAGDDTPIEWLPRDARYNEKLATPDVSMADLLGDIDPIKAATRKLTFADPEVIHFGIVPRTNRGIFAINELPDLAPRIQVGLFNILEERDLQIRGFPVRIPLDLLLVFSANPEDYTNRGSIIPAQGPHLVADPHPLPARRRGRPVDHRPGGVDRARRRRRRGGARRLPAAGRGDLDRRPRERARRPGLGGQRPGGDLRARAAGVEPRAPGAFDRRSAGLPAGVRPAHAAAGDHR
jgi:hypothetical protein